MAWNPLDDLTASQRRLIDRYAGLIRIYNRRVNLISRKSEDEILERHINHCLFLSFRFFPAGSTVVDWGTGGGLPGIPLAIRFPDVSFTLVDATRKKTTAVLAMVRELKLSNVAVWKGRAENWPGQATYSVSRATAPLVDLWHWHERMATHSEVPPAKEFWPYGLIALKGGDLRKEGSELQANYPDVTVETLELATLSNDPGFDDKKVVLVSGHPGANGINSKTA